MKNESFNADPDDPRLTPEQIADYQQKAAGAPSSVIGEVISDDQFRRVTQTAIATLNHIGQMGSRAEVCLFVATLIHGIQMADGVTDEVIDYTLRCMRDTLAANVIVKKDGAPGK